VIIALATDAALSAEFDRLQKLAYAANHAQPRTAETIAKAKTHIAAMQLVSDEISDRAGVPISRVALSDAIFDPIGAVVGGAVDALAAPVNKLILAMAVFGFAIFALKK